MDTEKLPDKPGTTCSATITHNQNEDPSPEIDVSIVNKNMLESIQCQHENIDEMDVYDAAKAGQNSMYSCWKYEPDASDATAWRCVDSCHKETGLFGMFATHRCYHFVEFKGADGKWHRSDGRTFRWGLPWKGKCVKVGKPQPVETCKSILGDNYDCSKGLGKPHWSDKSNDNDCSKGTGCTFMNGDKRSEAGVLTGQAWGLDPCPAVTPSKAEVAPLCCAKKPPAAKENNDTKSDAKLYSEGPVLRSIGAQAILPMAGFVSFAVVAAGAFALAVKRRRFQESNALMSSIDEDDTCDIE